MDLKGITLSEKSKVTYYLYYILKITTYIKNRLVVARDYEE